MGEKETPKFSQAQVAAVKRISDRVLCLTLRASFDFSWTPGQHVAVSASPDGANPSYYSIASAPLKNTPGQFDLAVTEDALRLEALIDVGSQVWLSRAMGGVPHEVLGAKRLVLVGMGTGVAPLRAIVQASLENEQHVTVVQGARRFSDCLFFDEFQALRGPRFEYRPVLSGDGESWSGRLGRVQHHLENLASVSDSYCVCGSLAMVEEVKKLLVAAGAREDAVFCEGYS